MSDEELERLAREAADAVGPVWRFLECHGGADGWVESTADGKNIGTGYEGEWDARAGRFSAAANPATVLSLLDRLKAAEAKVAVLEKEHEEDQGVIRVWRGRTERAEEQAERLSRLLESSNLREVQRP